MSVQQLKVDAIDAAQKYKARYKDILNLDDLDMFKRLMDVYNHLDGVGTVTSVGLSSDTGGVTIGNSPITTSGTITLAIATASGSQNGLLSSADWTTFNNKQNALTLTTTGSSGAATLIGGVLNIPNYGSALTGYVPYTGATTDVNLGTHQLLAARGTFANNGSSDTLTVNHTSGSGYGVVITKGGNNEALYVNKTSGSGNAATIIGGITLISELNLTTDLADSHIASAATWNAKQNAITLTTTGNSGASTFVSSTLNIPNYTLAGLGYTVPTLAQVTTAGNTTTNAITVGSFNLGSSVAVSTFNGFGLNYFIVTALTAGQGISAAFVPSGTPTGYAYNFQFNKSSTVNGNSLLFIGGGASAGPAANKHLITTSTDGTATAQPLVFAVATGNWAIATALMTLTPTQNVLIGTTTDGIYKLDVNGTARISNTLTALTISSNNITANTLTSGGGTNDFVITGSRRSTTYGTSIYFTGVAIPNTQAANSDFIQFNQSFTQTSGAFTYNVLNIANTYNQSSTANGTIRGIYYNPTLTSVLGNHIAIHTVSGKIIHQGLINATQTNQVYYDSATGELTYGAVPSGTVTSVGLSSATSGVTIGATPVTTSGTITLTIATAATAQNGLLSSTDWNTFNGKQNAISLTTTGTSGAATFVSNTLNIPNYTLAGLGYAVPTLAQVTTAGNTTTNAITVNQLSIVNGARTASFGFGLLNNPTASFIDILYPNNGAARFGPLSFDGCAFQGFGGTHATLAGQLYFDYGSQQRTVANRGVFFRNATNTSPVTVMKLTDTSNVLIGTSTDAGFKLDVNGTIRSNNVITATGGTSTDWNTAFGWGDHAAAGYLVASPGYTGIFSVPTNPPGMQNLDIQGGLIVNVF